MTTIQKRNELQRQAERGEITPKAYWAALKATWPDMTDEDKDSEYKRLNQELDARS